MPKLKQVASLQTMAMDVFFGSVMQCCNRLSDTGDRDLLRSGVIAIREEVYSRLPGPLLVKFASRFLEKFSLKRNDELNYQIALEMIMDIEIVGLRLKGPRTTGVLLRLDLIEGRRFKRLEELDLNPIIINNGEPMYRFLHKYHLNDLVTFIYPQFCSDNDLQIIGRNCPKLEFVEVLSSNYVTDQGLRGLSPCSGLRVLHFRWCPRVSYLGLNYLLSAHDKLEDFYHGFDRKFEVPSTDIEIDASSGLDLSVESLSINRLVIEHHRKTGPLNLEAVVKKFPNLIYLKINSEHMVNLTTLKCLNKLTGLEINVASINMRFGELPQRWGSIEEILTTIGVNITTLTLCGRNHHFVCRQEQLNLIFNCCPNLEDLGFDHKDGILVVPAFEKLKVLTPRTTAIHWWTRENCNLEFGKMLNLEILSLPYHTINLQTITSLMLDNEKFPKLSVLRIKTWRQHDNDLKEIERIAKVRNLDFRVEDLDMSSQRFDYPPSESSTDDSDYIRY